MSHQPFLLLITCLTARLGFNKFNGLGIRQDAAREPLLARCDNATLRASPSFSRARPRISSPGQRSQWTAGTRYKGERAVNNCVDKIPPRVRWDATDPALLSVPIETPDRRLRPSPNMLWTVFISGRGDGHLAAFVSVRFTGYWCNLAFRRGAAKSRNARSLIGRNRPAIYTKLTGHAGGWNSSSKVVSVPALRADSTR